jgi:hypothetical protein
MQAPGDLLGHRRALHPQFASQPQQIDLAAQAVLQLLPLAPGPARRFQFVQQAVDAPVDFQHRHPLGLGGMGGDDGRDVNLVQQPLQAAGGDAGRGGLRQHAGRCRDAVGSALGLRLPLVAHGGVLFGDAQELEPDALGLEAAGQQIRIIQRCVGLAAHHFFQLRQPLPHHANSSLG